MLLRAEALSSSEGAAKQSYGFTLTLTFSLQGRRKYLPRLLPHCVLRNETEEAFAVSRTLKEERCVTKALDGYTIL